LRNRNGKPRRFHHPVEERRLIHDSRRQLVVLLAEELHLGVPLDRLASLGVRDHIARRRRSSTQLTLDALKKGSTP
jgi:hypothetical protein